MRLIRLGIVGFVLALLAACAPPEPLKLTILHNNDVHSRLQPVTSQNNTCSAQQAAQNDSAHSSVENMIKAMVGTFQKSLPIKNRTLAAVDAINNILLANILAPAFSFFPAMPARSISAVKSRWDGHL